VSTVLGGHDATTPEGQPRGREVYRFTAEQVLRMVEAGIIPEDGSTELLGGILYRKPGGELHNATVNAMAGALRTPVARAPRPHHVRVASSITADPYSLPEPDVAVIPGGIFDYGTTPPPLSVLPLVVEVNDGALEVHTVKLALYAAAGVPIHWLVDVRNRQVIEYTGPNAQGGYDHCIVRRPGEVLDVVIAGHTCGRVRVEEVVPPGP
jgi:Uma2 family endonuclease